MTAASLSRVEPDLEISPSGSRQHRLFQQAFIDAGSSYALVSPDCKAQKLAVVFIPL